MRLEELRDAQPPRDKKSERKRTVTIKNADFNIGIIDLLNSKCIKQKEATFCLLDQRTFECEWSTVQRLAHYKDDSHNKIEIFYFLANSWFNRAVANTNDFSKIKKWWGREDWQEFCELKAEARKNALIKRFKEELAYKSVKAWPIYERSSDRKIMYYMIHATDHNQAPKLVRRAYDKAVTVSEFVEQIQTELNLD